MAEQDTQEKYKDLKKATALSGLAAICIFIFDSFLLGSPVFSGFVLISLLIYFIPATLFSITNRPKFMFFAYKVLIYTALVIASFGFYSYDLSLAMQRAEVLITAVNQYQQDKGHYPDILQNLVPAYVSEIPKPRIAPSMFHYLGSQEDPYLMYMTFPPFGRASWSFIKKEWISID